MIKFHTLSLRNFMSYGNVEAVIDLSNPGSTLITGRNLDDTPDGSASNGTGKTVVINAITFALYDKPLSNINKDGLVNTINGKHMEVSIVFEIKNKFYKITRYRKMKVGPQGNYTKLWERIGDANFEPEDEVTLVGGATNAYIEQQIGIPYELFVRIIVFSGGHVPFLNLPSKHPTQASQQSFIEELFDLKILTQKADVLKQQLKDNESEFTILQAQIDMAEKQKKRHDDQIRDTKVHLSTWNETRDGDIQDHVDMLKRIEGVDLDQQKQIYDILKEARTAEQELQSHLRSVQRKVDASESDQSKLMIEFDHLHEATCPYCKQEYHDEKKLATVGTDITTLEESVASLILDRTSTQSQLDELRAAIQQYQDQLQFDDIQELLAIKFKKDEIAATIERRKVEVNPYVAVLSMIESQRPIEVEYSRMNELSDTMDHQRFLMKLLTKNDSFIRKAMLNKNLPFLNKQLNYYLRRMGLPHIVEFTHDLTPRISRFGCEFDIDQLSTGQKARVNLALSLSFRDVLQNLHQKINLFCLDEVLDTGLDASGVMMAAKLLKEEARKSGTCMFVISHREEISSSFDTKMYVLYKDSFSRVYQTVAQVAQAEEILREAA